LCRAVVALDGLTLGPGFIHLAAYVHALMSEHVQTPNFLCTCSAGMTEIGRQDVAPGMLNADFAGPRVRMAGGQHLTVHHGIENGVAMNYGAMIIGELGRFGG